MTSTFAAGLALVATGTGVEVGTTSAPGRGAARRGSVGGCRPDGGGGPGAVLAAEDGEAQVYGGESGDGLGAAVAAVAGDVVLYGDGTSDVVVVFALNRL